MQEGVEGDPLRRNPGDCTCTDGGWIHRACMLGLAKHTTPGHRITMRYTESTVCVSCVHAPCARMMPLATIHVPRYHRFLEALVGQLLVTLATLWRDEGAWYACLVTLTAMGTFYAAFQPTVFRVAFAVLVVCVPFHRCEIMQHPDLVRIALYALAGAFLLPRTELATKMLLLAAVMWRAWLRRRFIEWTDEQARAALAAQL